MRFDLYQIETTRLAKEQSALLDGIHQLLADGIKLSKLEQNGVLHALQILTENAIGKSKQLLKLAKETVPVSAYDSFESLVKIGEIDSSVLEKWNAIIGLRNRIVHEYMNVDMNLVYQRILEKQYLFIADFLCQPIKNWIES